MVYFLVYIYFLKLKTLVLKYIRRDKERTNDFLNSIQKNKKKEMNLIQCQSKIDIREIFKVIDMEDSDNDSLTLYNFLGTFCLRLLLPMSRSY